jgi:uncharacterized protein with PIN domain
MRFLCEEMLARLARWLPAAGHDAGAREHVMLRETLPLAPMDFGHILMAGERHLPRLLGDYAADDLFDLDDSAAEDMPAGIGTFAAGHGAGDLPGHDWP